MNDFVSQVTQDVLDGRNAGSGGFGGGGEGTTYPGAQSPGGSVASFTDQNNVAARYKMFDLCKETEVVELEALMTAACLGTKMIRKEQWSHDKDGLTVVTVSWLDISPKKSKKKRKHPDEFYREGEEDEDMDDDETTAHVT